MSLKSFRPQDLVYTTIKAETQYNFIINNNTVYLQKERAQSGDFSNNIKHVPSGHVSLYEANINRPGDGKIYSYIEKTSDTSMPAMRGVTREQWQSLEVGDRMERQYPLSATLSRIHIESGREFDARDGAEPDLRPEAHENKKYIRALRNPINLNSWLSNSKKYQDLELGTSQANLICIPGIFCGSGIKKGSIELNYFYTGSLVATATDTFSDGRIMVSKSTDGTYTDDVPTQVGIALYDHGILILTSSTSLSSQADKFFKVNEDSNPSWINFGTGIPQVGESLSHGPVVKHSYEVNFTSINKTPTLTMFAFSEKGEHNFSNNPTFLVTSGSVDKNPGSNTQPYRRPSGLNLKDERRTVKPHAYVERSLGIAATNKSVYSDHKADFESTTYISKVGIYDEDNNLIAVANLANPIKKNSKRDFMIKMKIDF